MNTNYPNEALSDEPLIRFDLRGQFAMNRVIWHIKKSAADQLKVLGNPTIAPYLYNRRTRSFQCFAVHATAIDKLNDKDQKERLKNLRMQLRGDGKIAKSEWEEYWDAVEANQPKEDTISLDPWYAKYEELEYVEWLNYYFRYRAYQTVGMNGMLLNVVSAETETSAANITALGGLLVGLNNQEKSPESSDTLHKEAFGVYMGCKQFIPLSNGLKQRWANLTVHSELVKIFAYGDEEKAEQPSHVLIIPVYDCYNNGVPWGGIAATLQIPLTLSELTPSCEEKIANLVDKLQSSAEIITDHLASSAKQRAVITPTSMPLSLTHEWVRGLQFLQDWEEIRIERIDKTPLFWKRLSTNVRGTPEKDGQFSALILSHDQDGREQHPKDQSIGSKFRPEIVFETTGTGLYEKYYTLEIESAMRIDDRSARGKLANLQDIERITFRFPSHFRLPDAKGNKRQEFCDLIVRQQKEMLQVLEPKVLARRSAVRTAVSAIMGRNMSHNIGSHVIARYAGKAAKDIEKTLPDEADHRGDFLAYLQRRMDFLAEIATSDQTFWSQPLSLRDQVDRLNYGVQQKRFYLTKRVCDIDVSCAHHLSPRKKQFDPVFSKSPILLSFITGKESLLASVEYGLPDKSCSPNGNAPSDCSLGYKPTQQDEYWFACPGGEVGAHALFVILENVIRNSARHGGPSDDTVRIFVHVPQINESTELLMVELIDPRTILFDDGRESRADKSADESAQFKVAEEVRELEKLGAKSLYEAGKRKNLTSLTRNINSILSDEPFLDASGTPNPKYWGVREMQICAHYLRGYSLADLEGAQHEMPVLEAAVHQLGSNSYCLKYKLYLQRAKLLAAVVPDDSIWKKSADALRMRGVVVLQFQQGEKLDSWGQISKAARDYSFLAVDTGIRIPETDQLRTALPVRTFGQAPAAIQELLNASGQGLSWMEPLHKQWAEQCRDLRGDIWKGKPIYGVVIGGATALLKPLSTGLPIAPPDRGGGLFWVEKSDESIICPLPASLETWHSQLEVQGIAAAWVDHAGTSDFDNKTFGRLGHAAIRPGEAVKATLTHRVWISAEGAFSDSPHTAFLNTCLEGCGWELLAASVPRVVVLDERVQSERTRDARANLPLSELWPLMGVWVPTKSPEQHKRHSNDESPVCNLDAPDFNAIHAFLSKPAQREDQYPIDFLVIHLTILERLSKKIGKLPETLNTLKAGTPAENAKIIVVTGRGVPSMARQMSDDRMDAVRYLPISALLETLVSRPSKLALMRVLWSAGKPDESNN